MIVAINLIKNVECLKLAHCGLKDKDIKHLSFLDNLFSLNLLSNNITDYGVKLLSRTLNKVQILGLNFNPISDTAVELIAESFINLSYLRINCESITYRSAQIIADCENFKGLEFLSMPPLVISDSRSRKAVKKSPYLSENIKKIFK